MEDRRGQGGDRNPLTTPETEARGASGGDEETNRGTVTATLPIPQWGMTAVRDSAENQHRHPDGANGARPKHGAP